MKYYIVLDLEMCCVPKGMRTTYHKAMETIQIGAVKVNEKYEIIDKFSVFVKPEFGALDKKISKLTGIKNENLVDAPKMEEALNLFFDWVEALEDTTEIEMVSWSDTDYHQIKKETEEKSIFSERVERLIANWTDCQKTFGKKLEKARACSLEEALIATGIWQEGQAHNGLDDAYNTALLFIKMKTEPELKLNPIYENARKEEVEHLSSSIGSLLAGFDWDAINKQE